MKRIIICIVFALFHFTGYGQEGVNFENLTFKEALAKAKKEKKMIFMDCYTSWCAPCKRMANSLFPQPKAGAFFNTRFICVKYDMEKGEGPELAKKFGVKFFPTFFLIRPDGSIQHKIGGGSHSLDEFISWVEKGLNEKTSLDYLNKFHATGKMTKEDLLVYQDALSFAAELEKDGMIKKELFGKLTKQEKMQEKYWFLMKEQPYESDDFKLIIDNIATFRANTKDLKRLDFYLNSTFNRVVDAYVMNDFETNKRTNPNMIQVIKKEIVKVNLENDVKLSWKIKLVEAGVNGSMGDVIAVLDPIIVKAKNNDLWMILSVLKSMHEKANATEVNWVVDLGEKLIKKYQSEDMTKRINDCVDKFRNTPKS